MKERLLGTTVILLLGCIVIIGCGKKEDQTEGSTPPATPEPSSTQTPRPAQNLQAPEQAREYIRQQMEQMEARTKVMDARAAYTLALPEAQKWDAQAKLYQIKGDTKLTSDGTAAMWTAYFALRLDDRNASSREGGKKLTVLMMDQQIMKVSPKETPEDISYAADCYGFLPENWINSQDAMTKCLAALKDKHTASIDGAELKRLVCGSAETRGVDGSSRQTPVWKLSVSVDGSPVSATIDAVTGKVL